MNRNVLPFALVLFLSLVIITTSCDQLSHPRDEKKVQIKEENIDAATSLQIEELLQKIIADSSKVDDSSRLNYLELAAHFYASNNNSNLWSEQKKWIPLADTMLTFIEKSAAYGLFKDDYHFTALSKLRSWLATDSVAMKNSTHWAKADILFTDAGFHLIKDLHFGRLLNDSLLRQDSSTSFKFLINTLAQLINTKQWQSTLAGIEPRHQGYQQLKAAIPQFLDSMDHKTYTYVTYPFKKGDEKDSLQFVKTLQQRLFESNSIGYTNPLPDSAKLDSAIRVYQKKKGLKQDGLVTTSLIKLMNNSDEEKFKRIAISLDRYKLLRDTMPKQYIWVNLPAYYLELRNADTVALYSKIICGAPSTRTPLLVSKIYNMITYPTWTVPTSIIAKQYLPKLKQNSNYLAKLGLKLVNNKGEKVDPSAVSWNKYSKGIPYQVMQASGDNNALGVMKFNFANEHAVYLHDTNQRYLFQKSARALSHGCVRVQEWEKLAYYLVRNDSMNLAVGDTMRFNVDSVKNWLSAKKHRGINLRTQIPLYITYYGCEGKEGKIKFYEDIYGEDKALREKYFSTK